MVFAAAAVGAGLVRTVATTYLPVLLSAVKDAPGTDRRRNGRERVAGFAVPLVVGLWSDRRHTARHGRRPFLLGGAVLTVCGLAAIAFGYQTSFLMLTLAGLITYMGVNIVTTAHRTLVHDRFEDGGHARGNGAQEVAALAGALVGLVCGGMLSEVADWAPFALAAVFMPVLVWPTFRRIPVATHVGDAPERDAPPPAMPLLPAGDHAPRRPRDDRRRGALGSRLRGSAGVLRSLCGDRTRSRHWPRLALARRRSHGRRHRHAVRRPDQDARYKPSSCSASR